MNVEHIEQTLRQDVNLHEAVKRNVMQAPPVPKALNTQLMERLKVAPHRKYRVWPWMAAACIAAAVVLTLLLVNHKDTTVPQLAKVSKASQIEEKVPEAIQEEVEEHTQIEVETNNVVVPTSVITAPANERITEEVEDVPMITEEQPTQLEIIYDNSPRPKNLEEAVMEMMTAYRSKSHTIYCSNEQGMHATVTIYSFAAKYQSRVFSELQKVAEMFGAQTSNADFIQRNGQFSFELSSTIDGETVMDKWMTEESGNTLYLYHTQDKGFDAFTSTCFVEHIRFLDYESL
ncbi:MAG: hypothetical protein J5770_03685 [Bacteroidaceae bacterium]|nr:hypothetical protein [Bacteroidaceae bacterium]